MDSLSGGKKSSYMRKIHPILAKAMRTHPNRKIDVLVIVKEGERAAALPLNSYTVLTDNILSSTLDVEEIMALSKDDQVLSIEKDIEIGLL